MRESAPGEMELARGIQSASGPQPLQLQREPEDIAPFVTWLASDNAKDVNGYVFHCQGGQVSLMNNPEPVRTIHTQGRWTVEEIAAMFPGTLGMDMVNPAPMQAPRQ